MARKNIRLQYNAPVTLTFFFLSLASLVLGYPTNNWTTTHLFSVYRSSMTDPLFYVRLFGHVLGHGGWDHFINNMLLFLVVAPPLEERYGSRTLLSGILSLMFIAEHWQDVAKPFVETQLPGYDTYVMGGHLMFYEYPEKWNSVLEGFLNKL